MGDAVILKQPKTLKVLIIINLLLLYGGFGRFSGTIKEFVKMGGGDLNMKKSWHPVLLKNQEQVWQAEREAAAERKKIQELQRQIKEERELLHMQRLQDAATGKKRRDIVEWMYKDPTMESSANSTDREDFLLGRKRLDTLFSHQPEAETGKDFLTADSSASVPGKVDQRDIKEKVRNDPLLAIKREEQTRIDMLVKNKRNFRAGRGDVVNHSQSASLRETSPDRDDKDNEDRREQRSREGYNRYNAYPSSGSESEHEYRSNQRNGNLRLSDRDEKYRRDRDYDNIALKSYRRHGNNKRHYNSRDDRYYSNGARRDHRYDRADRECRHLGEQRYGDTREPPYRSSRSSSERNSEYNEGYNDREYRLQQMMKNSKEFEDYRKERIKTYDAIESEELVRDLRSRSINAREWGDGGLNNCVQRFSSRALDKDMRAR